jgi:hypothetical protein
MASTPTTYLALVNKILLRMREQRVGSLSGASDYVQLIQLLVKEAVDEVETAWSWNCLNTTVPLTLVGGTSTYSLPDLGDSFIINTVWNDTKNYPIAYPVTSDVINSQYGTTTSSSPSYCGVYGVDSNGDPQLRFYPTPTDADTITVYVKRNSIYTGADTDVILSPYSPVYLCALWKAISERGDDGGLNLEEAYVNYQNILSTYIARDAALGHTNTMWYAD